jgi:choline dehydrogenase-like flavoprotein
VQDSPDGGLQPEALEGELWDAVIAGTGMGGATLGLVLAEAGRRVLFIEKGLDLSCIATAALRGGPAEIQAGFPNARQETLSRAGRASAPILDVVGGLEVVPEVGCGTGGSTSLFGAVLERFFPIDFAPGEWHRDAPGSALPEQWPVSYEEMRPWYARAEELYRVRGGPDPLRAGMNDPLPAAAPAARALAEALRSRGAHPYPLPLACELSGACTTCQGYLCPSGCKNDADRIALRPALARGARLLTPCEVTHLEAGRTRVRAVHCRAWGRPLRLKARVFVLGCGALFTPALLLTSRQPHWEKGLANGSGQVGRNLMRHAIDLWLLRGAPLLEAPGDAKALGFNDLYTCGRLKLGSVQSFGAAPPLEYLRRQPNAPLVWRLGPLSRWLWHRYCRVPLLASILEDLPYPENRVEPGADGRLHLHYRLRASEEMRRRAFRGELRGLLRGLGATLVSGRDAPKALGHVCGTCRFGNDPAASVLDRDNRAHELDNLYVVDASFFPSSAGLNPALTIAANALRVGAVLAARL